MIFSPGHKATYEYIYNFIKDLGVYDVEFNEFTAESSSGSASVDGVALTSAAPMTFTPSGVVTGKVVKVANIGCDAVRFYPMLICDFISQLSNSVVL